MTRLSRPVSWIRPALRAFEEFPGGAREDIDAALVIAAEGSKADTAKPMHGLGSGVFEIALAHRGNAFRVIYAVQLGDAIWVIHAFQKKSNRGVRAPRHEINLVMQRIRQLKQMLNETR